MPAPDLSTVPSFYHNYIRMVATQDLNGAIDNHLTELSTLLTPLTEAQWNHAYAPGKWTIKELIQHIIDAERIFTYRALTIARQDPNPLPGFDENQYALLSQASSRPGTSLLNELIAVGNATKHLFESFNPEQLEATGTANGRPISVNAIGYILCGHALHHTSILKERYLSENYTPVS
jgi:hypothetical protein